MRLSTKERLLHIAAQCEQLSRELSTIGAPVSEGGASDISFAASHQLGVALGSLRYTASRLTKLAGNLQTDQV